jgi:iron(III) transport system substrate-binding protein
MITINNNNTQVKRKETQTLCKGEITMMKFKRHLFMLTVFMIWVFPVIAMGSVTKISATGAELALYKGSDRQQLLEAGAKEEGKLTFYTSVILNPAGRALVAAFEKRYPFIKVNIWRSGSRGIITRLTEEYRARQPKCDVVESSQTVHMMIKKIGIAQPYDSPNVASFVKEALTQAPGGGLYSVAVRGSGISLGYNANLIGKDEKLPQTYEDLLDLKWKGRMAIAGSNTGVNWMAAMLSSYGEDLVRRIAQQKHDVHMISGRAILDLVIAGEYALSPTVFDTQAGQAKGSGASIEWIPLEPVPFNLGQVALPKKAPNPHAAMLFVDFLLTRKSAEIYKSAGFNIFHKGFTGGKPYKKYFGAETLDEVKRNSELFKKLFLKK